MKKLNNAFTLTELLVALGVIGILCAILLPIIFNLLPNQNTLMAKRAYYLTSTVVADLINDEACYPDLTSAVGSDARVGLDDEHGYPNCVDWTSGTDSQNKFSKLFTSKINLASDFSIGDTSFITADGMAWGFVGGGFSPNDASKYIELAVDVNGSDKPNCGQSSVANSSIAGQSAETSNCTGKTSGYDRFGMYIYADGKITVLDDWAKSAIKVNKDITEE